MDALSAVLAVSCFGIALFVLATLAAFVDSSSKSERATFIAMFFLMLALSMISTYLAIA